MKRGSIDLIDAREACAIIGGSKPISRSTFYHGIAAGRYPPPVHVAPHTARWPKQEIESCVHVVIKARRRKLQSTRLKMASTRCNHGRP
ncbi:putative DNA-binding transcriptional regulator AlpA [Bradyrhizobium sp. LB1.3]